MKFSVLISLCAALAVLVAFYVTPDTDNFTCPNEYKNAEEYTNGTVSFISEYISNYPQATEEDIASAREKALREHNCSASNWMIP